MPAPIQITYLQHSGFAVQLRDTLLIFDNAQNLPTADDSLKDGHITRALINAHKHTIFFVSHAHSDHFNSAIFDYADPGHVSYILSEDIPAEYEGHRMRKGSHITVEGVDITAYDSTDEGVSYLVKIDGWTLFHAGDLNLWHWRSESSLKEIERAEKDYLEAVEPLIGMPIDFAFFPLDPRMGEMYDAGALHFLMHVKPHVMMPMHWWDRSDAALNFARKNRTRHVEIIALTTPGESFRAQKQEDGGINIDLL